MKVKLLYKSFILSVLFLLSSLGLHGQTVDSRTHRVIVSVAPHKFFAEKIAGDTITVLLMVPAGASSHTFEPNPKQMLLASQADIWFTIGEGFEARATKAMTSYNSRMKIVDLRKGVNLIYADPLKGGCCCCHANEHCIDLHFWLSPREAKQQAKTIAEALSSVYPENRELYATRLETFLKELDALDREIVQIVKDTKQRTIMVSHPAYAYFARDYGFDQTSIEFEGKDPTPQQLDRIFKEACQKKLKSIYIQMQYNSKGAKLIAQEIGAKVVTLDPYAEDYIHTMRHIATSFAESE